MPWVKRNSCDSKNNTNNAVNFEVVFVSLAGIIIKNLKSHSDNRRVLRLLIRDRHKIISHCFFICLCFLKLNVFYPTYIWINFTITPGYQVYFNLKTKHYEYITNEQSLLQLVLSNRHFAIFYFLIILKFRFLSLVAIGQGNFTE